MMSFALDEDQQLLVDTLKNFARDKVRPALRQAERAGSPGESLRREYNELAITALEIPAEVGGAGMGPISGALCAEELSFGDAGLAVALHNPSSLDYAALSLGSPEQIKSLLSPFLEDPFAFGAVAFADQGAPPGQPGLSTRATRQNGGWRLTGKKGLSVGASLAQRIIVFAQVEEGAGWEGVGAFVVERGDPNLKIGARPRLLGLGAVDMAPLELDGCYVSDDARLAFPKGVREGLRLFFARLKVRSAARLVGLARASYEYALQYASDRHAFGKPIAHFQAIAFMLSDMLMDIESARWLTWRAAALLENQERPYRQAAAAFAHASEYGQRVAERAVQILGGAGYVQDHPVEKWMRDAKMLALFGGASEAERLTIAEEDLGQGETAALEDLIPGSELQAVLV